MPHKDNQQRLCHMLDAAEELQQFTRGKTYDDLLAERGLQHICLHCLLILGEAANAVASDFQAAHPEIPWRPIIAMRHRLIHGYFAVELSVVWDTITQNIPPLLTHLRALLAEEL